MFDGISKGLDSGLKHIVKVLTVLSKGFANKNEKQMQDAIHVINVWLGDVSDEAGELKSGIANQILDFVLTGKHDPFVKSRQAAQDLENKYK